MIWLLASFNPRAREGRDTRLQPGERAKGVSIHAPARGATLTVLKRHGKMIVSIHAPARGATNKI